MLKRFLRSDWFLIGVICVAALIVMLVFPV